MRYAFIQAHRHEFRIRRMCAVLKVSASGYYAWARRKPSRRARENDRLLEAIRTVHRRSREAYGAYKTWRVLRTEGVPCGRHRVARLRRAYGIEAKRRRRFRMAKRSYQHWPAAPNLLAQRFAAGQGSQIWVGDTTFIPTRAGTLYLAVLIDLHTRKVVGWAMAARQDEALVLSALNMAVRHCRPQPGLIHHTDQGSIYRASGYRQELAKQGARLSMSGKGNAYDNAVAESFFSSLKNELVHHTSFPTQDHARAALCDYIEIFYNRQRVHASLNYMTPIEYEIANPIPN
jgi:transposase InsO family protein